MIFFLYRLKDVALYVTLFAIGHSVTLLVGVLGGIHANAYIVDAIIGLSVVYKALENIGAFKRMGIHIDSRAAVLTFGLCARLRSVDEASGSEARPRMGWSATSWRSTSG